MSGPSMPHAGAGVALVTGGAKRIGRAIVEELARAGYAVAIHCNRSRADADALAARLAATGARCAVVAGDLADSEALDAILAQAEAAFGPVDLLVNNASLFEADELEALEPERWDTQFAVNLRAPVMLAAAFARRMPETHQGAIVNIIDQRVLKLTPRCFSYTLTKSALLTATRTMAQTLAPRIRVNAVGPGPTLPSERQDVRDFARQSAALPLERSVEPAEVARAVLYLAQAGSVTGQMIAVDGGQHLAWRTPDALVAE